MTESPIERPKPGATWEIGELFEATWDAFKPNALVLVGATVIMLAASLIVRQLLGREFLGGVVDSGVQSFFFVGLYRICLDIARGRAADIGTLFRGTDRMLVMWAAYVMYMLAFGVGLLLLLVPGIVVMVGWFFFWGYAIESSLGPVDSLKASWELTRGRKWDVFFLSLAMAGVVLTGLVAFCVGIFAAVPFVMLAESILFVRLTSPELDAVATDASWPPPARPT